MGLKTAATWSLPRKAAEVKNVAVGVSGSGRSLENFLSQPSPAYQIAGVIASRPDCRGAAIARDAKLPLFIGDFSPTRRDATADALYQWLADHQIDLVALAGFLKVFPVRSGWTTRVINIHPALLPKFGGQGMYGNHVHAAVLASGDQKTGATIHYVDGRYDEGRILTQTVVEVQATDTVETLATRVFAAECLLYPDALAKIARGELA